MNRVNMTYPQHWRGLQTECVPPTAPLLVFVTTGWLKS